MKLRESKKLCKKAILDHKLTITGTAGRTFMVKPKRGFICMRWYAFIVISEDDPDVEDLKAEGRMPITEWKRMVWRLMTSNDQSDIGEV